MFKVIIAGSRDFSDYELLEAKCDYLLKNKTDIVIVSGTARGADQLGERYAVARGLPCERYPADWQSHGKQAGFIRNTQMADNADALIAFTNGSRGTAHMIKTATDKGLLVRVINF